MVGAIIAAASSSPAVQSPISEDNGARITKKTLGTKTIVNGSDDSPPTVMLGRRKSRGTPVAIPPCVSVPANHRRPAAELSAGAARLPLAARPHRIVALGGGTGLPAVLEGLAELAAEKGETDPCAITGIVTVTDDGGSSGRLREQYGMLPPGDARNCLVALTRRDSQFKHLLQHRLTDRPGVVGHPVGNLLLAALTQATGDFSQAVAQLGDMIGSRGRVLPSTTENVRLRAELECGETINGETRIVGHASRVRRLSLEPRPRPMPEVVAAIVNADAIVVGPGSLYTSVLPNLLIPGVAATIHGVNAVRIYVANLMTEPGETDFYTLDDHLRVIREHTGFDLFDYILVNRRPIDNDAARLYAERGSEPVVTEPLLRHAGNAQVVECDLAIEWGGKKIRHHPASLARAIRALVSAGRPAAIARAADA